MSGFSFGSSPFSAPSNTTFGFGTSTANAAPAFGTTPVAGATGFGATSATGTTGFGANTGVAGFGGASGTGATGFGAAPASGATGFGAAPATGTTGFGATPAPNVGGFGSAPASNATFNFGTPAATAATTTAASGFGFGGNPSVAQPSFGSVPTLGATSSAGTTFNYGQTSTPAASTTTALPTLGLGTNTSNTGFNFGTPAPAAASTAPTLGTATTGLSFGAQPASTAPTLGTGTTGFNFGATPTATSSAALTLGAGTTNFNYGTTAISATTTTAPTTQPNFSFGTTLGKTTAPSLSLGAITPATTTTLGTTTTAANVIGLGGVGLAASQQKSEQKTDTLAVKENKIPLAIVKTVEDLKVLIKQKKTIASEVARASSRKITSVTSDINSLKKELQFISDSMESNYQHLKDLRTETSKAIQNVEMAKRTVEIPPALQFENTAPMRYFLELAERYEKELIILRDRIELTEKQMKARIHPQSLTADDLKRSLKTLHECLIALAGRYYDIHRRVDAMKDQYMQIRSKILGKTDEPFDITDEEDRDKTANISKISGGPSPFSISSFFTSGKYMNSTSTTTGGDLQNLPNAMGMMPLTLGGGIGSSNAQISNAGIGGFGSGGFGGFGSTTTGSLFGSNAQSSSKGFIGYLNLQKPPPPGAKRNKQ